MIFKCLSITSHDLFHRCQTSPIIYLDTLLVNSPFDRWQSVIKFGHKNNFLIELSLKSIKQYFASQTTIYRWFYLSFPPISFITFQKFCLSFIGHKVCYGRHTSDQFYAEVSIKLRRFDYLNRFLLANCTFKCLLFFVDSNSRSIYLRYIYSKPHNENDAY